MALRVGEYVDNGEKMRFFLKDVRVKVRFCDRMYDLSCHNGHTTRV
jgi:hypothetical protein